MVDGPMLPYPVEDLQTLLGRALICAHPIVLVSMWLLEFLYRMYGFHGSHGFHGFYGFYVVSRVSIPHLRLPSFFHGFHGIHGFLGLYWLCVVSIVSTWFPRFLYAVASASIMRLRFPWFPWLPWFP